MERTINRVAMRREIRWMVVPIIMESVFALSGNLVFMAFLGRIDAVGLKSVTHVAAYGLAVILTNIVWQLLKGISIGATIRIAQAYGASDVDTIERLAWQTYELLLVLGVLSSVLLSLFVEPLVAFYKPDAETARIAVAYIRICCLGYPFLGIMHASTGILQGLGNTKTPMVFSVILNVIFIVVGLPLIFGWFGTPLGAVGSGYALVVGQIVTASVGAYTLLNKRALLRQGLRHGAHRLDLKRMKHVFMTGLPTSLENIFWLLAAMVIGRIMLGFGELQYAANQIGLQAEAIANLPAMSYGVVAMTLCGRAIGAKSKALGEAYVQEIRRSSYPVVFGGAAVLLLLPHLLLSALSGNADIIRLASVYLRLMGATLPLLATAQIWLGALKSAGHIRTPMLIALGGIWCVRVPLSMVAARLNGATIVWLWVVVAIDLVVRFAISVWRYRKAKVFDNLVPDAESDAIVLPSLDTPGVNDPS